MVVGSYEWFIVVLGGYCSSLWYLVFLGDSWCDSWWSFIVLGFF